jgi:hypothetical protein
VWLVLDAGVCLGGGGGGLGEGVRVRVWVRVCVSWVCLSVCAHACKR